MDLNELAEHVTDSAEFVIPAFNIHLPKVFGFQLTRYMVIELAVALLMMLIFIILARRIADGRRPRGRLTNMFEAILVYLRDEVARPAIGRHDADRFLPFVWNIFFFILFCNLMGILPWAGSPTGSLMATAALAGVTFMMVLCAGMARFGPLGYWKSIVPPMEVGGPLGLVLKPMLFGIEATGLLIKHLVLAVRLLANMFAGHLVLAVIVGFIAWTAKAALILWAGVTVPSLVGAAALTMLELFVAFLQAYVFAFLAALFIGMAVHPH